MTLGEKIKYYREKQKIGQEHLAKLAHISVSTIRKYESGDRKPKKAHLERLAHALHLGISLLSDSDFSDYSEMISALYQIGNQSGIDFNGVKDKNGKFISGTVSIKFNDKELMSFVEEWANKREEIKNVESAIEHVNDSVTNEILMQRIDDMNKELEENIVSGNIIKYHYFSDDLTVYNEYNMGSTELPTLEKYSQLLDVLNKLARTTVRLECVGVWERVWEGKAYITVDADTISDSRENEKYFAYFLKYYRDLEVLGIKSTCYGFREEGVNYYRYIIFDRRLAEALTIINDVIQHKLDNFFENGSEDVIKLFNKNINTKIQTYNYSIKNDIK